MDKNKVTLMTIETMPKGYTVTEIFGIVSFSRIQTKHKSMEDVCKDQYPEANAVIGVKQDNIDTSLAGKRMTGTAVKIIRQGF